MSAKQQRPRAHDRRAYRIRPATPLDLFGLGDEEATIIVRAADGARIIVAHRWTGRETDFWAELCWLSAVIDCRQARGAVR